MKKSELIEALRNLYSSTDTMLLAGYPLPQIARYAAVWCFAYDVEKLDDGNCLTKRDMGALREYMKMLDMVGCVEFDEEV
jgi:hypothetical protein